MNHVLEHKKIIYRYKSQILQYYIGISVNKLCNNQFQIKVMQCCIKTFSWNSVITWKHFSEKCAYMKSLFWNFVLSFLANFRYYEKFIQKFIKFTKFRKNVEIHNSLVRLQKIKLTGQSKDLKMAETFSRP